MQPRDFHDVLIVGGGPAGLSAALLLGRCLRRVLVCDAREPRNARSEAMHGYLGHDGILPADFLQLSRDQLARYETVEQLQTKVTDVVHVPEGFKIFCEGGAEFSGRALLLATGLVDRLPDIPGADNFYGVTLHHCPYCDGWEHRGQKIGVLGADEAAVALAVELRLWSREVTLFAHGVGVSETAMASLRSAGVRQVGARVRALEGEEKKLKQILLEDDSAQACDALFFSPAQAQHDSLARRLGCMVNDSGCVTELSPDCSTRQRGVYVAGNVSEGIQMAIMAAAEGLNAAAAINNWLLDEDRMIKKQVASGEAT